MELVTCTLLILSVAITWLFLRDRKDRDRKLPPGPAGVPFIGCPWILFQNLHLVFSDLAKTWGPVFSIKIFRKRLVVLNSAEAMREAYAGQKNWEDFSGRPPVPLGNPNLLNSTSFLPPTERWTKQRRVVHKILNFYGEGIEGRESTIQEELSHVVEILGKNAESVDLSEVIYPSLINTLTILLKGRRYDYGSPILKNAELMDESVSEGGNAVIGLLLNLFPFLKYIPYGPGKLVMLQNKSTAQLIQDYFEDTKATYDPNVTRGMIDFLLHHQRGSSDPDERVALEDKTIKSIIQEMIAGGAITTRGALYSFFLIICHKPEVSRRIQTEMEEVVGLNRVPRLDDRSDMPYTAAAILELLRYISHVPIGLRHVTMNDVTFWDYFLPKNTTMVANAWNIHHDTKYWDNPWTYNPERFLDAECRLLPADHINRKNLMPFGVGRRSCVGETFAKSRMFLFITTLLQRFDFCADPTRPLPSCDPRTYRRGAVISPERYYVTLKSRS